MTLYKTRTVPCIYMFPFLLILNQNNPPFSKYTLSTNFYLTCNLIYFKHFILIFDFFEAKQKATLCASFFTVQILWKI